MPEMAKKAVLDLEQRKLFIDGAEFPWYISEDGPTVACEGVNEIPAVALTFYAESIEVIPRGGDG